VLIPGRGFSISTRSGFPRGPSSRELWIPEVLNPTGRSPAPGYGPLEPEVPIIAPDRRRTGFSQQPASNHSPAPPHARLAHAAWTTLLLTGLALALLDFALPNPANAEPLDAEELELKVILDERGEAMQDTLERWVNLNTGSFDLEGLESQAQLLASELDPLGFQVQLEPGPTVDLPGRGSVQTGPIVVARREAQISGPAAPRFLLVGHYDTVFEKDSPFQTFVRAENDPLRAQGPGSCDMKGGLVILIEVLRGLRDIGELDRASWVVLLNGDEEIGSLGSREQIEAAARQADYGFVFESGQGSGAMVRSRRGLGQFHLSVEGVSSHAGSAHERGRSAIAALAAKVLEIEALTDYDKGITLNVGTISGGTKRNIVPALAEAWIDLRYDEPEDGERIRGEIEAIAAKPHVPGTTTSVWGTLHRPPKLPSAAVDRLLERHAEVVRALGETSPEPRHSGGGTDGSLMGAVGLTTLDSLGAIGGRAHTTDEFIDLASLPRRATIAAILLHRLIEERLYAPAAGG